MSGFAALYREAVDHPLFVGDSSRLGAWTYLVLKACWKPTKFNIGGKITDLDRGQLCVSRSQLSEAWGWKPSAVERFLVRLETEQMIGRATGQGRTVITICNYAKYQDIEEKAGQPTEQAIGQPSDSHRTTKEQGNQETKAIPSAKADGRDASSATPLPTALDVAGAIFRTGVTILKAAGHDDRQARSIIGRWRKTYSNGTVLAVLANCQNTQPPPSSPVEWITKALQAEQQRAAGQAPAPQETRPERASVSEIGAQIAARKQRERHQHQQRIAIGGR